MKTPIKIILLVLTVSTCWLLLGYKKDAQANRQPLENPEASNITSARTATRANHPKTHHVSRNTYPSAFNDFLANQTNESAWKKAMKSIDKLSPQEAREIFKELHNKATLSGPQSMMTARLMMKLASRWADELPEEALSYIGANIHSRFSFQFTREALSSWAKSDLDGSVNWLKNHQTATDETSKNKLLASIHANSAQKNPIAAIQSYLHYAEFEETQGAEESSEGSDFNSDLTVQNLAIALHNAHSEEDGALALSKLEPGYYKDSIYAAYSLLIAKTNIPNALSIISEIEDPGIKNQELSRTLKSWVSDEPKAALEYIESIIKDDTIDPIIVSNVVSEWSMTNNEAAAQWLSSWEYSPEMNGAISAVAINYADNAPEKAMQWLETIQDPVQKKITLKRINKILQKLPPQDDEP